MHPLLIGLERFGSLIWLLGPVSSRDKLKQLSIHFRSAYGHQIWQNDDLPCEAPSHKFR